MRGVRGDTVNLVGPVRGEKGCGSDQDGRVQSTGVAGSYLE